MSGTAVIPVVHGGEDVNPAISVSELTKRYGEIEAVRGIDFEVAARRDLRLPRPERGGQVRHDQDPVHPGGPDLGFRQGRRA